MNNSWPDLTLWQTSQSLTSNQINCYSSLAAIMSLFTKLMHASWEFPSSLPLLRLTGSCPIFYWKANTDKQTHQFNSIVSCPQQALPFTKPSILHSSYNWSKHRLSECSSAALKQPVALQRVFFANSVQYELFWMAEHYSLETDPSVDGDKWAWLNSPSPAEETEWLACAQGSGRCREGDAPGRGDLPNERRWLRFEIMLPDIDSSMGTIRSRDIIIESGLSL